MKISFTQIYERLKRFDRPATPQKWLAILFAVSVIPLLLLTVFTLIVDPFMRYHVPYSWSVPQFSEEYFQIPGVLRQFDYDSVIVGSSMSQNFRLNEFREKLGKNPVKATARGLLPATGKLYINIAGESRGDKLQTVYWGVDILTFNADPDSHFQPLANYVYSNNHFLDVQYWWNWTLFYDYYPAWLKPKFGGSKKTQERYAIRTDIDRMFCWDYKPEPFGMEAMAAENTKRPLNFAPMKPCALENFKYNVIETVRKYPDTEFIIFTAPYSVYFWSAMLDTGYLQSALDFRTMMIAELLSEPNVKVYDFAWQAEKITDADAFKDLTHFGSMHNSWMVDCMAEGKYRITELEQVEKNNGELQKEAAEYLDSFRGNFDSPNKVDELVYSHRV